MASSERMLDTSSRVDLFGRTEAQLRASIAWQERIYAIKARYGGNEGASITLAIKKSNLDVDRRQLAIMRGELVEERPAFSEAARVKLYRELLGYGRRPR
jgi:hypothetical protein